MDLRALESVYFLLSFIYFDVPFYHHPRIPAAVETVRAVSGRRAPIMDMRAPGTLLDGSPV